MIRNLAVRFERVSTKVGVAVFAMAYMAIAVAHAPSPGLSSSMEPASGLHPSGFDPTIAGELP